MASVAPAGWEGLLEPGERLLWQGRPDGRVHWRAPALRQWGMGLGFGGFGALVLALAGGNALDTGLFVVFGAVLVGVGVYYLGACHLWYAWLRRRTDYAVTDRRALIRVRGRLRAWVIGPAMVIDADPPSVWFARAHAGDMFRGRRTLIRQRIGFDPIEDAAGVAALMRQVQAGRAGPG